jgi:hypothetical protein
MVSTLEQDYSGNHTCNPEQKEPEQETKNQKEVIAFIQTMQPSYRQVHVNYWAHY